MHNKLNQILATVGLLRALFSQVMSSIHENREGYKTRHAQPPEELIELMARAQELFAELLKSSESLMACREKLELQKPSEEFDDTIGTRAVKQTLERLRTIDTFLMELETIQFPGLDFDPAIWKNGRVHIQEALESSVSTEI